MNIDKSQIIGKSLDGIEDYLETIVKNTRNRHKVWINVTVEGIDFLSRCTLCFANNYGATYQISQTKELTIVSNKGQSYTLESYDKFLNLKEADYLNLPLT